MGTAQNIQPGHNVTQADLSQHVGRSKEEKLNTEDKVPDRQIQMMHL
jgi:hypothetical protein